MRATLNVQDPYIADTGNILCPSEVLIGGVTSTLARIVHKILNHFSKGSTLFAEVDDYTTAAVLCLSDCFANTERQVWSTGTDI